MMEKPSNDWPGSDDRSVVAEMMGDPQSPHWTKCNHFIQALIQVSGVPEHAKEDVAQDTLLSVMKYLPTFHFDCRFTTWLAKITRSRIADHFRQKTRVLLLSSLPTPEETGADELSPSITSQTTEEVCLLNEKRREAILLIEEYLLKRKKKPQHRQILQKVLLEEYSYQEAAQELGIPAPNIRYIVDRVRKYLNERFKD